MGSRRHRKSPTTAAPARGPMELRHLALGMLTALLTATPLIPSESIAELGAGLFLNMLWLVLLAAWAVAAALRGGSPVRAGPVLAAVVTLAALVALSGWIRAWDGNPRATINSVWTWVCFAVAFFLARQWVVTPEERRAVCAVMIALAVALAGLGYYQYFVSQPATLEYFEQNREKALREAMLDPSVDPQVLKLIYDRVRSVEPLATFALTNSLAGFLAPWLVIAAGIGVSLWRAPSQGRTWAAGGVVFAMALIGGCFFLTKSRTAWLAAICGFVLIAYFARHGGFRLGWRIPLLVGAGAATIFVSVVLLGGVDAAVVSEAPKSLLYRFEYWQATAAMIRDYPLWGVGVGNFQSYYTAYKLPQASETVADPHSFLFEIWANSGLLALVAFLAVFGLIVVQLRPAIATQKELEGSPPTALPEPGAGVWAVYVGAVIGVLLAYPVGLAAQFPPDRALLWSGMPLAMICAALLHPWTRRGRLPLHLPLIAVVVMLINFLAAGGIGFASVATSLWLLLAVTVSTSYDGWPAIMCSQRWAAVAAVAALGLVAACYFTAYGPVLSATPAVSDGLQLAEHGRLETAEDRLLAAAAADPWSRQPREALMSLHARRWIYDGSPASRAEFEHAQREALRRNGHSYGLWKSIGDLYLERYQRDPQPDVLHASIDAYRKAVSLYPARASLRVELAWRLNLAGEGREAAELAAEAIRLDARNPHYGQKLADFPAPAGAGASNLEHAAENLRKLKESPSVAP